MRAIDADHLRRWILSRVFKTQLSVADVIDQIDREDIIEPQPEIIRCKDCKYQDENWRRVSVRWLPCMDVRTGSNWYCGSAERGDRSEQ